MPQGVKRIPQGDVAHGQGTDDGTRRLRTGIAAGADEQGDEKGQGHNGLQLLFKMAQDAAGQGLGQEQQQQPAYTLAHDYKRAGTEIRAFEGLGTAEALDVFGVFLFDNIHHIVNGDHPHQPVLGIHHRQGQQIVTGHQPRHFLLIHLDRGRNNLGVHQIHHPGPGVGGDELA
jgi:hypothetical protein